MNAQQHTYLEELMVKRRATSDRHERKSISKSISRQVRKRRRDAQTSKIQKIISDFKGFKQIAEIKGGCKKHGIPEMRGKDGKIHRDRQAIADVFSDFYAELYATKQAARLDAGSLPPPPDRSHISGWLVAAA